MNPSGATTDVATARRVSVQLKASDLFHAEWEKAAPVHLTSYWSGQEAPLGRRAEARLLWSDEAILVRFDCRQSEPLVVSDAPQTESKTMKLWERDVCEIFIAPEGDEPEHYFEFEAAPTGEWIDLEIRWRPDGRETDWHFHSGMTAAGRIEAGRVLIGMSVPWEAFGRRGPSAGERWRVNLFRCVGAGADRGYLAWRPTLTPRPNFHVPQAFGHLIF